MRIAVLDPERSQSDLITQVLAGAGHACHTFATGKDMLAHLRKEPYDMLIADWAVPDMPLTEVLARVGDKLAPGAPVMFITGTTGEDEIIAGLEAGASDFMVRPLRRAELLVRVQAMLRRAYPSQNEVEQLQFGQYLFETRPGRLLMDGELVDVTHKEFSLALLFFRNIGRPLSRAFIHESVWVREQDLPSRTMDTHVSRVRNKLQLRPENGYRLVPVYSYGYRLEKLGA